MTKEQKVSIIEAVVGYGHSVQDVCKMIGRGKTVVYRALSLYKSKPLVNFRIMSKV